ncbi:DNA polymerase III PolC-type-like [Mercenaria mercenaria]|uniref:DNA polymerase III PolC-type-like n=1 Tax=Mercenaria mercenaria TaxID=6596 RepID=UPI00234E9DFF|nr:DNA polymerase III PolC-type-like [Mercenaria mercenaria]
MSSMINIIIPKGIGHHDSVDVTKLPDPVPRGVFKPIHLPNGNSTPITFDLETTDLIRDGNFPHITQIAAMELETSQSFNRYVLPKQPIAVTAQQVTGISLSCNEMTVNGHIVEPSSVTTALNDFCTWLEKFNNVILVAHNGRRFDVPVIISAINNVKLQERFFKCVSGCTDSLSVFRKQYPGRSSYKQIDLVHDILGATYGAHDATEDVRALGHLLKHSASHQTVLPFSFSPEAVYKNQIYNREKSKNFPSVSVLVSSGICKLNIAENIAGSGLNL